MEESRRINQTIDDEDAKLIESNHNKRITRSVCIYFTHKV